MVAFILATDSAILSTARILRQSGIVAFPTETFYGLGASIHEPQAEARIDARRNRLLHGGNQRLAHRLAHCKKTAALGGHEHPSLEKLGPILKFNGTVLINTTLIPTDAGWDDLYQVTVPATTIASESGNSRAPNLVALGALIERTGILSFEAIIDSVIAEFAKKENPVDLNLKTLEAGRAGAADKKDSLK